MKKKVSFEKKIDFPTMIGEISAISLEQDLRFTDESNIEGYFLVAGKYKQTEASRLEEDFSYKIPTEIALTEKMDLNTSNIEITDFSYEVENDDSIVCHIELLIEGLELVEEEETLEERECDGDIVEKEIEIPVIGEDEEVMTEVEENHEKKSSFFFDVEEDSDTYGTFIVYLVRQNESIQSIIEKYHTTLEEVEKYNDVHNINVGSKLIIPILND